VYCLRVNVYCHRATTQSQLINIIIILSSHLSLSIPKVFYPDFWSHFVYICYFLNACYVTRPFQQFVLWAADECDMCSGLHMTFVMYLTSCAIRRRVVLKIQLGADVSEIPVTSISRIEEAEGYKPLVLTYQITRRHALKVFYLRYCCQSSKIPFAH
jgi:hypothetical protein